MKNRFLSLILSLLLLLPFAYLRASAEETPAQYWPMFRQNESGTGESNVTLKTDSMLEQWRFQTGSSISCSPVVYQGTTYILSDNRKLYALETESGQKRWESEEFVNYPLPLGAPTISNDRIYFLTGGASDRPSYLYCYSTEGYRLWNFAAFGQFSSHSPLVYGNKIFAGASTDILYCINAGGNQIWQKALNSPILSAPVLGANRVFTVTSKGRVYAFDYESLADLFEVDLPFNSPSECKSSPVFYDGVLYVASKSTNNKGEIFAINAYTGEIIWRSGPLANFVSSLTANTNFLFVGSEDHVLYAIGRADGKVKWKYSTRGRIMSTPAITEDKVFTASADGNIYALDFKGDLQWKYSLGGEIISSPAISSNKLTITQSNNVVTFADDIDFSISALPSELSLYQGEESTIALQIQSSGSISQNVFLRTDSVPLGFEAVISPNILKLSEGRGNAILKLKSNKETKPGTHTFFVIAETAGRSRKVRITVEVLKISEGSFFIQITPQTAEVNAGNAVVYQVEVGSRDQFKGSVQLSVLSAPSGFQCTFQEARLEVPGITNLVVFVDITVDPDRYSLTVEGLGGGKRELSRASMVVQGTKRYDWPGFGNSNQLTNYTKEAVSHALETRYIFQAEGAIRSQAAIVGDTAYFTSEIPRASKHHATKLYAIDIRSGELKWDYFLGISSKTLPDIGEEGPDDPPPWISSPRIHGNKLFVGTLDGLLFCIDTISGRPIWFRNIGSSIRSSPSVGDGKVYFGTENNRVFALDIESGEQRWMTELKGPVYSSPAFYNNRVYVSSYDNHLHCLSSTNGLIFWSFNGFRSSFKASPSVGEQGIYIGGAGENKYFYRINHNGTAKWQILTAAEIPSTAALDENDQTVYYLNVSQQANMQLSELTRLNTESKEKIWGYAAGGGVISTSPVIADDKILFGGLDKSFNIVGKDGRLIFKQVLDAPIQGSPSVGRGVVLVGTNSGKLYGFTSSIMFTLIPEKQIVNLFQGESTDIGINVLADTPLKAPVKLSADNLPVGATIEFIPPEVNQFPGSTVMRIKLTPHTPIGKYTITILGTSGTFRRSTTIELRVQNLAPGKFSLKTASTVKEINAGSAIKAEIIAEPFGGFNAPVSFSVVSELPDHIQALFNPKTITLPGSTTLTIQVPATANPQQFEMTVRGDGGGKQENIVFSVSVYENMTGDFSIRVTPLSRTVYTGEKAEYEVVAEGWDGFNEVIELDTEGLPNFLQHNFQVKQLRNSEKTIFTILTTLDTPTGNYAFFLNARAQKTSKKIPLTIEIIQEKGDFSFNFPPNFLISMTAGTQKEFAFQPTFTVNWNAPVSFSILNLPPNLQAQIYPSVLEPKASSKEVMIRFLATESSPSETYSLSLQGSGGGKTRTVHFRVQILSTQQGYLSFEIAPSFPQIKRSHNTPIDINIVGAIEISYFEFRFSWDPILASVSSIQLNPSLQSPSTGATLTSEINQEKGIALIKVTIPVENSVSGNMLLLQIFMSGINKGEMLLSIDDTIARNKALDLMPSKGTSVSGLVTLYLPGDVNGDGKVDIEDLVLFARAFGSKKGDVTFDARADFNNDGFVDGLDLILLAYNWGESI